ncbi:MAG: 50S ribosomal protein L13 [Candidatus Yanofskybacteria bacterium]|nr:50S ribosomal protein L13 [Candidatus Yanofskybacteria bacterium]
MIVHEIDATNQSLGRMASRIAMMLRAKDTPGWTPNIMPEVQVVVHNLDKVVFKGTKATSTVYYRHSGYPGGLRERTLEEMWERNKKEVLRLAVRGMLPENRQRDQLLKNLIVK